MLFQLVSHKGLRVLLPFLMMGLYASNAGLLAESGYRLIFVAQTAFFLSALLGLSPRARTLGRSLITAPHYVCTASLAALVAFYRLVGRRGAIDWS